MVALDADTQTFFRLGETIEHQVKKHATIPPKDFHKWARICEKIIRHMNEGWADGHHFGIEYWEIWNEPDLDAEDAEDKRTWGGTKAQFFDMYEITAKHLKKCFPHLKIGGPALAWNEEWADDFLGEMKKRGVEIDFFSWHVYAREPVHMMGKAERIKKLLVKHGYENAESILNEWNYIKGWTDEFVYSIKAMHGLKGSSFTMSCICEAQKSEGIDMLMYYDTRPSSFCGAFDFYTSEPLKGYYPFLWYGKFYDLEAEVRCENQPEMLYSLCGVDKDGKAMCIVTHYCDDDNSPHKEFEVDFGRGGNFEIYMLDEDHDGELVATTSDLKFSLPIHASVLIKEI